MVEVVILKVGGTKELADKIQEYRNKGWVQVGNMIVNAGPGFSFYQQMEKVTEEGKVFDERERF